jgi:polyhydroxyalkanoate synthesis regulator protein
MVNVIRAYGTGVQGVITGQLEQSLRQIMSQQPQVRPPRMRGSDDGFKTMPLVRNRDAEKERDDHFDTK